MAFPEIIRSCTALVDYPNLGQTCELSIVASDQNSSVSPGSTTTFVSLKAAVLVLRKERSQAVLALRALRIDGRPSLAFLSESCVSAISQPGNGRTA